MYNPQQIKKRLRHIVNIVTGRHYRKDQFNDNTIIMQDLGLDSLEQIYCLIAIESIFKINLPMEQMRILITIEDLVQYIQNHSKEDTQL